MLNTIDYTLETKTIMRTPYICSNSLTLSAKIYSPGGDWATPSCSATLGQPVEGTKQASDHFLEEKIDVKSSRQCRRTRFYTGKNSL